MLPLLVLEHNAGTASVRERELDTGRLVLRALTDGDAFRTRRAQAAVQSLENSPARKALARISSGLLEEDPARVDVGLLGYGVVLERHGEYDAAIETYRASAARRPDDLLALLHIARAARKAGRRGEAMELYRQVGTASRNDPHLGRLVRIGEALVSDDAMGLLDAIVREARAAKDFEALAVAREERSRLRASVGDRTGAIRDLIVAASRFPARTDRVRVLHRMAELLSSWGDAPAAREALLAAADQVDDRHREHTMQRLRTLARAMGDQLALRRTRGQGGGSLVTLAPMSRRTTDRSLAPRLARWRGSIPRPAAC